MQVCNAYFREIVPRHLWLLIVELLFDIQLQVCNSCYIKLFFLLVAVDCWIIFWNLFVSSQFMLKNEFFFCSSDCCTLGCCLKLNCKFATHVVEVILCIWDCWLLGWCLKFSWKFATHVLEKFFLTFITVDCWVVVWNLTVSLQFML